MYRNSVKYKRLLYSNIIKDNSIFTSCITAKHLAHEESIYTLGENKVAIYCHLSLFETKPLVINNKLVTIVGDNRVTTKVQDIPIVTSALLF